MTFTPLSPMPLTTKRCVGIELDVFPPPLFSYLLSYVSQLVAMHVSQHVAVRCVVSVAFRRPRVTVWQMMAAALAAIARTWMACLSMSCRPPWLLLRSQCRTQCRAARSMKVSCPSQHHRAVRRMGSTRAAACVARG